jgi:hypothetical protein
MAALLRILFASIIDVPALALEIGTWTQARAREYLHRLRGLAILSILLPYCVLFFAALIGGVSPFIKTVLVYTAIGLILSMGIILAIRSIPLVAIISAMIIASRRTVLTGVAASVERVVEGYIQTVGGILCSLVFISVVVLFVPMHNKPEYIPLAMVLSIILFLYFWWRGGFGWWPHIIYGTVIVLLIWVIGSFYLPTQAAKVEAINPDKAVEGVVKDVIASWNSSKSDADKGGGKVSGQSTSTSNQGRAKTETICPGDEVWLEAGKEVTLQVGERSGCNVASVTIPTNGKVLRRWIYPGGRTEEAVLSSSDPNLPAPSARPSMVYVRAITDATLKAH